MFHSSPYYTVVTALDYHQLLCLLCSDFPRSIILEAIKVLEPEPTSAPAEPGEADGDPMFNSYQLSTIQRAVVVFFYFSGTFSVAKPVEFMDSLKTIFQEAVSSSVLNITETAPTGKIVSCVQTYLKRTSRSAWYPQPSLESVLETMSHAAGLQTLFDKRIVTLAEDVIPLINGKISFKQFCQVLLVGESRG